MGWNRKIAVVGLLVAAGTLSACSSHPTDQACAAGMAETAVGIYPSGFAAGITVTVQVCPVSGTCTSGQPIAVHNRTWQGAGIAPDSARNATSLSVVVRDKSGKVVATGNSLPLHSVTQTVGCLSTVYVAAFRVSPGVVTAAAATNS